MLHCASIFFVAHFSFVMYVLAVEVLATSQLHY